MEQITLSKPTLKATRTALCALATWILCALLPSANAWANGDEYYTGAYDYGGEAVHLSVEVDQRGPETMNLRRLLSREHRINTNDYILLAVVVDNLDTARSGFARLSVGGHKGPDVETADFQTRLLAPADERKNWKLYLSRDAKISGFTAILAPRAYSSYRGTDYGYYDRGYLDNSTFYGWIWRDRNFQHPYGHRFYNRGLDQYRGSRYDPRFSPRHNRIRDQHFRSHRHDRNNRVLQSRIQQRARPGFGDRALYDHERAERNQYRERQIRDRHLRQRLRNNSERTNRATQTAPTNTTRSRPRTNTPRDARSRAERPRAQQQRARRSQANQARAQRRSQLNKQRTTRPRDRELNPGTR